MWTILSPSVGNTIKVSLRGHFSHILFCNKGVRPSVSVLCGMLNHSKSGPIWHTHEEKGIQTENWLSSIAPLHASNANIFRCFMFRVTHTEKYFVIVTTKKKSFHCPRLNSITEVKSDFFVWGKLSSPKLWKFFGKGFLVVVLIF